MIEVKQYDAFEWLTVSELIHGQVFKEYRSKELNRIDFALVAWKENEPIGYVTCRAFDSETIYMGFGGAFKQKSADAVIGYFEILKYLKERYKRATTLIENNNQAMLKLAMKAGFLICGIKNFKGSILLEHLLEWGDE